MATCDYRIHYRTHSGCDLNAFPAGLLAIVGMGAGERLSQSTDIVEVKYLALAPYEDRNMSGMKTRGTGNH